MRKCANIPICIYISSLRSYEKTRTEEHKPQISVHRYENGHDNHQKKIVELIFKKEHTKENGKIIWKYYHLVVEGGCESA